MNKSIFILRLIFPGVLIGVLVFSAQIGWAHGGHAPTLLGDPYALPPGSTVVHDGAGRMISLEMDTNRDGRIDLWNFYEKGVLARQSRDEDGDGKVDLILTFDGEDVVLVELDRNTDGAFDLWQIYRKGKIFLETLDIDYDHLVDRWTFFDPQGREALTMSDRDGDGVPDDSATALKDEVLKGRESTMQLEPDVPALSGEILEDEVVVTAGRSLTAASDQEVRDRDFASIPMRNPSDLVRLIPGVQVSQHTGGAKAYQYFLRGFDAEHGQDLAAYLDGIQLNEPSQVHGHGYLDIHFLIPETLASIRIIKGPYDPEFGNFATAGAIDFLPRKSAKINTVAATAGMFGTVGVLGTFGLAADPYLLSGAVETDHSEGYADPGQTDAVRANTVQTFLRGGGALTVMTNHYGQKGAATDVIPERWVKQGKVDRFRSLDPSDLVISNRHLMGLTYDLGHAAQSFRAQGYFDYKRTTIWSNYTFYLFNPELGDQQQMRDNRDVFGCNLRYRRLDQWGSTVWDTTAGVQWRYDRVDQVLANSRNRVRFNLINDLGFSENAFGFWFRENAALTRWLALVPGVRLDLIHYRGDGTQDERFFNIQTNLADILQDVNRDWNETAAVVSPKASMVLTPLDNWNLFFNYGEGFFSNTTLQMANEPKSNIPKVRGGEIGTRLALWDHRIQFAEAAWFALKDQDLVFDPQTGLSVTKSETRRLGLDGELRMQPLDWFFLTTNASYVDARFVDSGERIPNGPIFLMTQGIGWTGPVGLRGMVIGRYMGERELDLNDFAPAYYVVDLVAGYDTDHWGIELAVDNVLDTQWEDAVFSYETRPEKNGETLGGIHWTPGSPLFARLTVTARF